MMIARVKDPERLSLSLLIFLAVFVKVAFSLPLLSDGDTWWHLAAGEWITNEMRVPAVDIFSHSRPGAPWHAHEWLAEVLIWNAYDLGGWRGLIALAATLAAGSAALLCHYLTRWMPSVAAIIVTMFVGLCMVQVAWVRPHLFALPLLLGWTICLLVAREKGRAPPLPLAAVMIVWANLHGSFLLGLALIGPFALEALLEAEDRRKALFGWGAFALLAGLAALVTPFGINGFLFPLQVSAMETLQNIGEWKRTTVDNAPFFFALLFAGFFAFLARGVKFPLIRAALFVGLLAMAFTHLRHQSIFAPIGALLAAEPLGRTFSGRPEKKTGPSRLDRIVLLALAALVAAAIGLRLVLPVDVASRHRQPLAAIAHVPPAVRAQRVFNYYNFGGPLIFSGIKPFIDGRADMYGDVFFKEYIAAQDGDPAAIDRVFRRYDVGWSIMPPTSPVVALLRKRGWTQLHADERAVIQLRPTSAAGLPGNGHPERATPRR